MNSSDLINCKVIHKTLGEGTIIDATDKQITVNFDSKELKMVYPDSFERFIVAKDDSVQSEISLDIKAKKSANAQKLQADMAARKSIVTKTLASGAAKRSIDDGFGSDYNVQHLARQPILNYKQVEEQFGIKISGFGRGINRTASTVVLISSIDKKKSGFVYHDHWTNEGDYIYSGEGKIGDQTMSLGNKAIVDATQDGKQIHLFVKFSPQEYYYQGVFSLVDYTYEDDKDESGNMRKEYKFQLRKLDENE